MPENVLDMPPSMCLPLPLRALTAKMLCRGRMVLVHTSCATGDGHPPSSIVSGHCPIPSNVHASTMLYNKLRQYLYHCCTTPMQYLYTVRAPEMPVIERNGMSNGMTWAWGYVVARQCPGQAGQWAMMT